MVDSLVEFLKRHTGGTLGKIPDDIPECFFFGNITGEIFDGNVGEIS